MNQSKPFQLLIKPVGPRCNLSCHYCFYSGDLEPDPSLPAIMPDDVLESMISRYLSLRLPQSVLCWQGGEPTLTGLDFFRRVIELEKRYGRPGQVVSNALQTNGQLIDEQWARLLGEYRFLVGLSIDGPADVHDAQRVDKRGRGSLEQAINAARLMDRFGVEYNILTVVHRGNEDRGAEIFNWQLSQGWKHLQYIPCVEQDAQGQTADYSVTPEGYGRFMADVWRAYRKTGRRDIGLRTFDSWLSQMLLGQATMCTLSASCGDYLLVKPDGGLYPCDFYFDPQWHLGNVLDDDLAEVMWKRRAERFGGLKGDMPEGCAACRWLKMCHGGCPKDRDSDGRSYLCNGYKHVLEETGDDLETLVSQLRAERAAEQRRLRDEQSARMRQMNAAAAAAGKSAGSRPPMAGRNDVCPCGSGRKFKHCCGRG